MDNWPRLARFLTRNKISLLLIIIFAVSLSIRLYKLDGQTLECDELYTIPAATGHQYVYLSSEANTSPITIPLTAFEYRKLLQPEPGLGLSAVRSVLKRNVHLPLYFSIIHYWVGWFGNSEWILRFPSAFFGALTAMMIFLLGKELFNSFTGLVSSILSALSPEQVYFSQQARMYTLLAFLMVSSTYAMVLAARRTKRNWPYFFYALLSIAGLYTHYEYVFCLAAQTLYVWIGLRQEKQNRSRWIVTQLFIIGAFLPWVLISVAQKKTSPEIIAWVSGVLTANLILTEIVTKTARLIAVPELPLGWLSVVIGFILLVLGGITLSAERAKLFLLSAWIACPILGVLLMDNLLGTRAITITRYWIVIAPAFYLLMSLGLASIKRKALQFVLVAGLSGFLLAAAVLTAQGKLRGKPDRHKEMAQFIDNQISASANPIVVTEGLNSLPLALAYYGQHDMKILRHKWLVDQLRQRSFSDITHGASEILLMVSGPTRAVKLLEENGFHLEGKPVEFGHVVTAKYILNRNRSAPLPSNNDMPAPLDRP